MERPFLPTALPALKLCCGGGGSWIDGWRERVYRTFFNADKSKLSHWLNEVIKDNRLFNTMKIANKGVHAACAYPLHACIGGLVTGCHGDELCQITPVPPTTATSIHPKPSHMQSEKKSHLQNTKDSTHEHEHVQVCSTSRARH